VSYTTKKKPAADERAVLREFTRRFGNVGDLSAPGETPDRTFRFRESLFAEQLALIDSESRLKVGCCSRRAGKSTAAAMYLIEQCLRHPESLCVYLATSRMAAKRILWLLLKQIGRQYDLKIRYQNTDLIAHFPNGSRIELHGCSDAGDLDRLRGNKFRLVVIDEAGHFNKILDELVQETIAPGCIDLDGTIVLIGTPSPRQHGLFYEAFHNPALGYEKFHWTLHDNPYLNKNGRSTRKWLDDRMAQTGMTAESAIYQREWCGRFVQSDDSLVYKFSSKNFYEELPLDHEWFRVIGCDIGFHDASAFSVIAYSPTHPAVFLLDCWSQTKMLPTQIAEKLSELMSEYKATSIQMDTAGAGKAIAEEMKQRFGLPIRAAKKTEKVAAIELLNGELASGRFFLHKDSSILEEWSVLSWSPSHNKLMEDPRFPNHESDATLYAFREARNYAWRERVTHPPLGTREYMDWEMNQYWEKKSGQIENKNSKSWMETTWTFN